MSTLAPDPAESQRVREVLREWEASRPDVVMLAMLASLARRIEPELLRALRLKLKRFGEATQPWPTVGTEAALWFSPFVESRGADSITLQAEFSALLREKLRQWGKPPGGAFRQRNELLEGTREIIVQFHAAAPPVTRWEEDLIYLAVSEEGEDVDRHSQIDREVWRAVKALATGQRRGLGEWIAEMGPRLPQTAQNAPLMARLQAATHSALAQKTPSPGTLHLGGIDFADVPSRVLEVARVTAGFHVGDLLGKGQFGIRVPDIEPVTIQLLPSDSSGETRTIIIPNGGTAEIPTGHGETCIRTIDGRVYALERGVVGVTEKGTCFVVMGFGKKTDFETGRVLDLDQSYQDLIKPAVEAAGFKCVRADEIVHSGLIDVPMYELLLKAEVVVADLSTSNRNAIYELGVRHALRPYTTIVIAEEMMMKSPTFDLNHIVIRKYRHLGEGIGVSEAKSFTTELTAAIQQIMATEPKLRGDSPVYRFIDGLSPPSIAIDVTNSPAKTVPQVIELEAEKGTCFVVMGFGKKADFETGRVLDLDQSYLNLIKPAVETAGLKCVRADEIVHSALIDVPMYEMLLKAEIVVVDLSTSNRTAIYELGVRHALRPYTTIVIAEEMMMKSPTFDLNHIVIRKYRHLGEDIGVSEQRRFTTELTAAIQQIMATDPKLRGDSPVYKFIERLTPPSISSGARAARAAAGLGENVAGAATPVHSELMQRVDEAQRQGNWVKAKMLLEEIREMRRAGASQTSADPQVERSEDPYILQRLALATYKSKYPTPEAAFKAARDLLKLLEPQTFNDTETLGLWAAVHKRLWELTKENSDLDEAVRGYKRVFSLRKDHYNGINYAFLLNVRATLNTADSERAGADVAEARRAYQEVVQICEDWLAGNQPERGERKYWVLATLAEAHYGLGEDDVAEARLNEAYAAAPEEWMKQATEEQLAKLRGLLANSPISRPPTKHKKSRKKSELDSALNQVGAESVAAEATSNPQKSVPPVRETEAKIETPAHGEMVQPVADVFISYSRKDRDFVRRLDEALKVRGREAWVDSEDIRPTEEFMQAIYAAIEGTDTFVFVLTPDSVASVTCRQEIEHAAAHNKRIVPILARDVNAATVPKALAERNWIFCREGDDFEKAIDLLISALDIDREWMHAHTRLLTRAIEWNANGKSSSFLLRGKDLQFAEEWLVQAAGKRGRQATALQTEYVIASRKRAPLNRVGSSWNALTGRKGKEN